MKALPPYLGGRVLAKLRPISIHAFKVAVLAQPAGATITHPFITRPVTSKTRV